MHSFPNYSKNRTIGLLGGSFNPAHEGHLHITLHSLHKLGFDEVWWLVSPQNPLKSAAELASYERRVRSAQAVVAGHSRVRVLDIEARFGLRYTYETLAFLQKRFRGTRFVWMMGADNLAQFHRWQRWDRILAELPVVVFDRTPYSHTSLRSKTMVRGYRFMLKNIAIGKKWPVPCLVFEHLKRNPLSSTALRKKLGKAAFLRHNKNVGPENR